MNAHIALSILIGLAWLSIAFIALASLALGVRLGREHVFTAPGVSRLGPRIGRRIAGMPFAHHDHGATSSLRDLVATDHPTLLLFVGRLGLEADLPHVKDILIPDLLRFAMRAKPNLELAIFCQGSCDSLRGPLISRGTITFINAADDQLTQKLGVRVTPFALLVDRRATVLAKGIVNNAEHLCHIVARGGQLRPGDEDLERVAHICQPSLTIHPHAAPEAWDKGEKQEAGQPTRRHG